jgi:hypothetical protein
MKHPPGIPDGNLVDHISFVGHGLSFYPCFPAGPVPSWLRAGRRDLCFFLLIIDEFYIRRETVSSQFQEQFGVLLPASGQGVWSSETKPMGG